jgi:secernin
MMPSAQYPAVVPHLACDSLVALGAATADATVLFAKNSDRPANECQGLMQAPRQQHAPGARLRCTYIDIPQVAETARLIGSRPFWCWGFEHGLNEHGVAIGNHTVFSKDALHDKGLIGMDLVRLGLERARSADEAVEVISALLEQHGQGGSGYHDKDWPHHNSFLVADRTTAYILETSDRHWATRRVEDVGSVSNHLTIGSDWDALSDGHQCRLVERGDRRTLRLRRGVSGYQRCTGRHLQRPPPAHVRFARGQQGQDRGRFPAARAA